jgi:fructose-specific phosphotransferase system IIA component
MAIPVIIIARVCVIYILVPLYNKFAGKKRRISRSYQAILLWGGLRGAVPVALVFSIPASFPGRAIILHLTFGFILFTLLFQGTTIKFFMGLLGIKPEKNELEGVKNIVSSKYSFGNEYLTTLVFNSLLDIFSEEGFFISRDEESGSPNAYILKKQDIILLTAKEGKEVSFSYKKEDTNYLHTILYETLLEFDKSLREVGDIVKPEELNKLVDTSDDSGDDKQLKREINVLKSIPSEHITTKIESTGKNEVIGEMLTILHNRGVIPDYDEALKALLEREETMTTGIGDGIALPHAKIHGINKIQAVIAVKKEGVDFHAMDGKPVNIIVLILSPASDPVPHIQFLAAITKLLSNKERKEKIIASDESQIYQIIKGQQ